MLHVRLDLITAGPPALAGCLKYIESEVRPALESQHGSLGLSLLADETHGVGVLESFWASERALRAAEGAAASIDGELKRRAGGSVIAERYRVGVFELDVALRGQQSARLTRMEVEPSAVEDVIEAFGDTVVPWLAETSGFRCALLLADPASGHLISQTVWQDPQARTASPSAADVIRADSLAAARCMIRAVEDYSVVFSSARNA